MIFNLVEAAQEFLSEIGPVGQSDKPVRSVPKSPVTSDH